MIEMTVSNHEEVVRKLMALPDRVYNRVLGAAMRKVSKPVIMAARRRAPIDTLQLSKSLGVKIKRYPRKGVITAIIGARSMKNAETGRNPAFYSHIIEGGRKITRRATLGDVRTGTLVDTRKGLKALSGRVPPKPFLVPALKSQQQTYVRQLRAALAAGVEREARRLARKGSA